ncbi:glutamate receptor U1-like [Lineus longissimus]|uniref:glutamate receptor U1-like n=1 Tax=Lineus longissimus TaxID=88925 RepID=UPI002B4EDDE7
MMFARMEGTAFVLLLTAVAVYAVPVKLKAVSILQPPFLMEKDDAAKFSGKDKYEGFVIDLLDEACATADCTYDIQLVADGKYGQKLDGGKWSGMVGEVLDGKADLIAAPLTLNTEREAVISFTKPWMTHGLTFMMNREDVFGEAGLPYNLAYFLSPFSVGVWLLILLVFFVVSMIIALFNMFDPYEYGKKVDRGSLKQGQYGTFDLREALLFCFAALTFQGVYKPPLSIASRVMAVFWWFFCVVTVATYIAAMVQTTALAGSLQSPKFAEFRDLVAAPEDFKFGPMGGGSTEAFFKKSRIPEFRKASERMSKSNDSTSESTSAAVKRVQAGKYAFIGEFAMIDYVVSRKCDTVMVGSLLTSLSYAFGLAKASPNTAKLSAAIQELGEAGNLNALHDKWWHTNQHCRNSKVDADEVTGRDSMYEGTGLPITLNEFGGPLIVLLIGVLCAVIALVAEIVYYKLKGKKEGSNKRPLNETGGSTHPLEEKA